MAEKDACGTKNGKASGDQEFVKTVGSVNPCYAPSQYKFLEATCHSCGKKGHISQVCCSRNKKPGALSCTSNPSIVVCKTPILRNESADSLGLLHLYVLKSKLIIRD